MKARLTRYLAWLRKEWRDQRAILLGIAVAIPGLTALAYGAFGENLATARIANVQSIFLAIAVGLVVFAVAGDLFAGENRRKTIHAMRRLPGGMGASFAAKVTLLVLALVGAIALQGLSLALAEHWNTETVTALGVNDAGRGSAARAHDVFAQLATFPTSVLWLTGLGFAVFGLWTLLVSSWMGRSGVAGIGAAVLLAALAAPFVLLFKEHPWFFPGPELAGTWAACAGALVALGVTALSFLRGQRFAGRPFRPFLLGATALLVALGGGYAYARQQVRAWIDFGPDAEDLRIHQAAMGADGRHLYLTVARGSLWHDGRAEGGRVRRVPGGWHDNRGTPAQAWVVDLADGSWRPVDERAPRYFLDVPECDTVTAHLNLDPVEALVAHRVEHPEHPTLAWFDARAGAQGRALPFLVRDAEALDLVRRQLKRDSWVRDSQGRRVWLRDGVLEREGDAFERPSDPVARPEARKRYVWMRPVPGGWFGYDRAKGGGYRPALMDADTGTVTRVPMLKHTNGYHRGNVLSPTHVLVRQIVDPKSKDRSRANVRLRVQRVDEPHAHVAPKNEPPVVEHVIARDLVLALRGEADRRTLHAWNPRTGADRPLRWQGTAPPRLRAAHVHGRTGDGRILLQVWRARDGASGEHGYAVLDAELATLRMVVPIAWRHTGLSGGKGFGHEVIALMPDDSVIMRARGREILRVRPGGATEVLFPRR